MSSDYSQADLRQNVIRLAFDGDSARFDEFCSIVRDAVP